MTFILLILLFIPLVTVHLTAILSYVDLRLEVHLLGKASGSQCPTESFHGRMYILLLKIRAQSPGVYST